MTLRLLALVALLITTSVAAQARPDALLAIDQNRATVIDRVMRDAGDRVARDNGWDPAQLRSVLSALRADELLVASVAGSDEGLRTVVVSATAATPARDRKTVQEKAMGAIGYDVAYTPVTPCRLVDTRGSFAAVYQGGGAFGGSEIRTYTLQTGNGTCVSQLPAGLGAAAVQLQVFGMPTTAASGDIEILPQGSTFGSTATMVYVGSIAFNTVSTAAKINTSNNQISIQVRGGGAHVAIDVVGYFRRPDNYAAINTAFGFASTIGGGGPNTIPIGSDYSTIAGGSSNTITDSFGFVGGGYNNSAGLYSAVGGGYHNIASGAGGAVLGGQDNVASGNYSAVLGGLSNTTPGLAGVAAGFDGHAYHDHTFIFSGWSSGAAGTFRPNSFQVSGEGGIDVEYGTRRNDGGGSFWFLISNAIPGQAVSSSTGASLSTGGVWTNNSDRARKTAIQPIDPKAVLRAVTQMPITSWRYLDEDPAVRHIGPMAQDFHAAVGYGLDNKSIGTVDADGVALAAIQALNAKLERQERELRKVRAQVARLKKAANAE